MQRDGEGPLASQFATVLEPYESGRTIQSITPLEVTGGAEGEFAPMALRVETGEFTDMLIIQPRGGEVCSVEGGLSTDAEFALWRERDGVMQTAVLVRGTSIEREGQEVALAQAEYTGAIESCDWDASTVRVRIADAGAQQLTAGVSDGGTAMLDAQFTGMTDADASALVGRMAHISNDRGNGGTHRILEAKPVEGGLELTLDYDPRVAEGPVAEVAANSVRSGQSFVLDRFGYYNGKTLASEDGSASWRITHIDGRTTPLIDTDHEGEVSADALREAFTDHDGDGVQRMVLYAYGPGDTVTIPCWASVTRR
jgi:hypothetical protein